MARFGPVLRLETEIDQGVQRGVGGKENTAPGTAIAAVGPAELDVFFPAETQAAVATLAGFDNDFSFINELQAGLTTLTNLRLCGPLTVNRTTPSAFAYRV